MAALGLVRITQTIFDLIYTNWTDDPDLRIQWPHTPFEPPQTRAWIGVDVLWGSSPELVTKGTLGRNRLTAVVSVNIYGPPQEGLGAVTSAAETVRNMFTRVKDTGSGAHEPIRYKVPTAAVPVDGDDKWTVVNVSVAFTVDETT